ncbi:hypothetical protein QTP70_023585 [Hemibagrus guttatus]|uniref:Uncharacterized protein n=1 Tax=Hemibagrus guttatus TaxID=175788 RepID=A0AAE0UX13_9TELE|nr:hypothetical protein QTP70_023585 [Hemibagrus guttatus]
MAFWNNAVNNQITIYPWTSISPTAVKRKKKKLLEIKTDISPRSPIFTNLYRRGKYQLHSRRCISLQNELNNQLTTELNLYYANVRRAAVISSFSLLI